MKKLKDRRGETLVEVLASILIASVSVALLFGCVMASSHMDRRAGETDGDHYAALTAAETRSGSPVSEGVKVKIVNIGNNGEGELTVDIYGGAGTYSYKRAD